MSTAQHEATTTGPGSARWIGDATRPEFAQLLLFLQYQVPTLCTDMASALAADPSQDHVRLVVVAPSNSNAIGDAECHALCARYAAATVVHVLGPWWERAGRTLTPDGKFHRVPWHAFRAWWTLRFGGFTTDGLARPSANESLAMTHPLGMRIGIVAANEDIAEIHGMMLRAFQITSQWLPALTPWARLHPFDAFVWDELADGRARPVPLPNLAEAVPGRLIIALRSPVNIPSTTDSNVVSVGKPYLADELVSLLRFYVHRQRQSVTRLARTA